MIYKIRIYDEILKNIVNIMNRNVASAHSLVLRWLREPQPPESLSHHCFTLPEALEGNFMENRLFCRIMINQHNPINPKNPNSDNCLNMLIPYLRHSTIW